MNPAAMIRQAAEEGLSLALSPTGTIKATGNAEAVNRWLPVLREHKPALVAALAQAANDSCSPLSAVPVVRLRLVLEAEDGSRSEAVLAIPKARYDGLRVLELFERHHMAGTTRILSVSEG
jgi:hypothetical protein